ncbi:hypothetical protein RhiirA1_502946 [Rhizophagus irregularis]|uniref:Uncharacterized protein n=1 Tax=Rhizophagus irregularis TaxID=588596 RepID=A0A2N0S315_9GLOM|nr:hypothetical protein RhiirA1_502946 [Rhizophagus irregularis]
MSRDSDSMTRKDGQRLSKINLSNDEWIAIKQLIDVLEPFASATKLLEGSKYATISFMNDVITAIKNGVQSTQNVEPNIDFTYPITVFDDDIGIKDPDNDDEVDDHPKWQKILINTPQDCKDLTEKNIFANHRRCERQDEIDKYMMIEEIDVSTCPFKWWASQESQFPILS